MNLIFGIESKDHMEDFEPIKPPNVVFRRAKNRAAVRRPATKPASSSSDDNDLDERIEEFAAFTSTAQKRRQLRQRNMVHTTSKKKRTQLDELEVLSSSEKSVEEGSTAADDFDVKVSSSLNTNLSGPRDMGATARSEVDTEHDRDAQAQFERVQKMLREQGPDAVEGASSSSEKVYRGMAFYGAKAKEDTAKGSASSGLNRIGPIRATQYMRSSVRWDYAPDICKDYKETGYCTFGDSCKFMHDRSDYKHGWQLEREWEQGKFKESKEDEYLVSSEADSDEDDLPHSCHICRELFKNPVVTKCKHYFCESCALSRCKKTKKCAVCDANTEGHFAVAKEIIKRMATKKPKENDEDGDEVEGSDDDTKTQPKSTKFLPLQNTDHESIVKEGIADS